MLPEQTVRVALDRARRRLRIGACANAAAAGSVAVALATVLGLSATRAVIFGSGICGVAAFVGWRRWTDARVAQQIEGAHPLFQNILVTAQEVLAGRKIHPVISRELLAQAAERLQSTPDVRPARTMLSSVVFAVLSITAAGLLIARPPHRAPLVQLQRDTNVARAATAGGAMALDVTVIPPAYTRRPTSSFVNPAHIQALEGSTIRLEVADASAPFQLLEPGREPQTFAATASRAVLDVIATTSRVFVIRRQAEAKPATERLLQLQVQRDERPVVTIEQPGRDLLFGAPSGTVPIVITARDDLNVAAVSLRYTHIAGSGETFTFEEGELPLRVSPGGTPTARELTGTLRLDQLKLQDGDTLVYRAVARDDKPDADPVASESFLVEIGRRGEASSSGFSLPENRDRQGLSQQMLVVKTERLHARRAGLTADAVLEQSRLLAVEQRMVRAEFVFMTGGEVVDEVEEAAHSHELAAGRLENAGQVELLNAIREMSRAEARLNAGDTGQALVFERAALKALDRAFDRRRYFLRTLPERTRIDPSRRLTGDSSAARPTRPLRTDVASNDITQNLRDVISALSVAIRSESGLNASLAARVIALDPQSGPLQDAAVRMSSGVSLEEKVQAAVQAQAQLATLLRRELRPAPAQRLRRDPLAGVLVTERQR